MTLLTIFRRQVRDYEELVLASDSRLSGGQAMDYGQKVFEMPRSDALFAFAGQTDYAYPLMMQMLRAVEGYPYSADRRLPLPKLKGHTLRVFQQSYAAIHSLPHGQPHPDPPDNYFLLRQTLPRCDPREQIGIKEPQPRHRSSHRGLGEHRRIHQTVPR